MKRAKLFKNGQSQAVRLPKEFQFKGKEVYVLKNGTNVILMPVTKSWERLRESLAKFSDDFLNDRSQPTAQNREDF